MCVCACVRVHYACVRVRVRMRMRVGVLSVGLSRHLSVGLSSHQICFGTPNRRLGEGRGLRVEPVGYPTIKFLSSQIPHVTQMHNSYFKLG